jgi:hypothetical protein
MPERGNRRPLAHARFFLYLERNPFAFWLCLLALVILLLTLASASDEGEVGSDTKVIFPVPGIVTRCPIHVSDAVKECHSTPNDAERDVMSVLDQPGTYIIRIK